VAGVQPEMSRQLQVQYGDRNTNTTIVGTSANYLEVRRFSLDAGRMFTNADDAAKRRVVVLGSQVVDDLGIPSAQSVVGGEVRINSVQFDVIGVLASKGQGAGFGNPDDQVLIPIQTARYRLMGGTRIRTINLLAPSEAEIPLTMAEVEKVLRREHRLRAGQDDDFSIRNQSDFLATLGETTQVFTLLLAGIAAVSLLVGGIGIMNIMLVSVTERTREIGIRRAIGARQRDILFQFLIEAAFLSLAGGALGVLIGMVAASMVSQIARWPTLIQPSAVALAFGFASLIGLFFGYYPALRAARLDPVEALRYE
jgi:putative ABC transport system permease protein